MSRARSGLLALVVVLLSGCTSLSGTEDLDYVPGSGGIAQVAIDDREAPVEVSGSSLQGDPVDLADFRGEVTVVNVWWSGCGPCRTEMPMLVAAEEEGTAEFVGINIRDSVEDGIAFERARGVDYPSIADPGSETLLRFGSYPPRSMPSTVILDREGRVAAVINGAIPSELTLTELIDEVAADDG